MPVEGINLFLAVGTIAMQVVVGALLIAYLMQARSAVLRDVGEAVEQWGLWIGLLLSFAGTALTLFYSEVIGYIPCGLCWMVRVFLYPQVLLFAIALWRKDVRIADYSIGLSVIGLFISLYTHYLQMGGSSLVPCPASGVSDCARRLVFEFDYITMPLMGATVFALLIVTMLFVRRRAL